VILPSFYHLLRPGWVKSKSFLQMYFETFNSST